MATARLQRQPAAVINPGPINVDPTVEIFASPPAFKIQQGKPKTINLTGSVYNNVPFIGQIIVSANPTCPILPQPASTPPGATIPAGANEVIIPVTFTCPKTLATGSYNCTLKYAAVVQSDNKDVSKGNPINISFNVIPPRS